MHSRYWDVFSGIAGFAWAGWALSYGIHPSTLVWAAIFGSLGTGLLLAGLRRQTAG